MDKLVRSGQSLFAIPWIVIGIQHFMYAGFLETLVPEYMPVRGGWVYFTGIGMMAAGVSFIIDVKTRLAALGIGVMLMFFIFQLHVPLINSDWLNSQNWTRAIQDITIAFVAFTLTGKKELVSAGRYVYAVAIIFFGVQHFMNLNFVTAQVPDFMPFPKLLDYLLGTILIIGGTGIFTKTYFRWSACIVGIILLLFVMLQIPGLLMDLSNPIKWIIAMLELAIASGAWIIIRSKEGTP